MNHIELLCAGSTIAARINGILVASVQDSTYLTGQVFIGAGVDPAYLPGTVDARFGNLVIRQP